MSRKLLTLSVLTFALALVFSVGGINSAKAFVSDNYNNDFTGPNLVGVDEARHSVGSLPDRDSDMNIKPDFKSYGLQGDWAGQQ